MTTALAAYTDLIVAVLRSELAGVEDRIAAALRLTAPERVASVILIDSGPLAGLDNPEHRWALACRLHPAAGESVAAWAVSSVAAHPVRSIAA